MSQKPKATSVEKMFLMMMNNLKVYKRLEREPKIAGMLFIEFLFVLLLDLSLSVVCYYLTDKIGVSIIIFSSLLLVAILGKRYLNANEVDIWGYLIYQQPFSNAIIALVKKRKSVGYSPFSIKTQSHDEK